MSIVLDERREFERVRVELDVAYRLVTVSELTVPDGLWRGGTSNISPMGLLLVGPLPSLDLVVPLLAQKVILSIELFLPKPKTVLRATAKVTWVEAVDESRNRCAMGLAFSKLGIEERQKLFQFLVWQRS